MVCFLVKAGCAASPPPPPPFQYNRFRWRARIPLQPFNDNQRSLFAHVVKSLKLVKTLSLNSVC